MQRAPLQRAAHRAHSRDALGVHDHTRGGGRQRPEHRVDRNKPCGLGSANENGCLSEK